VLGYWWNETRWMMPALEVDPRSTTNAFKMRLQNEEFFY